MVPFDNLKSTQLMFGADELSILYMGLRRRVTFSRIRHIIQLLFTFFQCSRTFFGSSLFTVMFYMSLLIILYSFP